MPKETELPDQFTRLSPFEQSLLHLLSIVYEPAHTTLLVNCLRKLELHNPRGNRATPVNLNHYLAKFEQLGFLTADHRLCLGWWKSSREKRWLTEISADMPILFEKRHRHRTTMANGPPAAGGR